MRAAWAAVIAGVALSPSACVFAFGSAYVGQWRAREEVEMKVCVEDDAGGCASEREVRAKIPARPFWGVALAFPSVGGTAYTAAGRPGGRLLRLEIAGEILAGYDRYALGVRPSYVRDTDNHDRLVRSVPLMALGHVGISERLSLYAGGGWSASTRISIGKDDTARVTRDVLRGLAGMQVVITRNREEQRFFWGLELDGMRSAGGGYSSWGVTSHLGISI